MNVEPKGPATVYRVEGVKAPGAGVIEAKQIHAEKSKADYSNLIGRKIGENATHGYETVVVVNWSELE